MILPIADQHYLEQGLSTFTVKVTYSLSRQSYIGATSLNDSSICSLSQHSLNRPHKKKNKKVKIQFKFNAGDRTRTCPLATRHLTRCTTEADEKKRQ
jgi:hypothetical protein